MVPLSPNLGRRVSRGLNAVDVSGVLRAILIDAQHLFRRLVDEGNVRVWEKGPDDPVTQVDLQLDRYLRHRLLEAYPEHGWLSEESVDDRKRLGKRHVWIVDPLDGTRQFVAGVPEYAISVALVEAGRPVVAGVAVLASGELYTAARGQGAWRDGVRLRVSDDDVLPDARVLVSRNQSARGDFAGLEGEAVLRPLGSMALKLARVADGYGAGTFTRETRHEWDVAAGALLVEEAGGRITDAGGRVLEFNTPHARFAGVVASNGRVHPRLVEVCARSTNSH